MNTYIKPQTKVVELRTFQLMASSPGIGNGNSVGNEYDSNDVTYTHENKGWDIWGNEDASEE